MSGNGQPVLRRGQRVVGPDGRRIGTVDAIFADYLLVRSGRLLPVDLYVPRPEVTTIGSDRLAVRLTAGEAYEAWHRPLKRAPHA